MDSLKAGQIVICTDATGGILGWLTEGQEYIIEWVQGANIKLVGYEYTSKLWCFKNKQQAVLWQLAPWQTLDKSFQLSYALHIEHSTNETKENNMNIERYNDYATTLQIVDISGEDVNHLIEICRYFTKRWNGVDGNDAAVMFADNLMEQLKEATNDKQ